MARAWIFLPVRSQKASSPLRATSRYVVSGRSKFSVAEAERMTIRSTGSIVCRFDRLGREIGFDPLTKAEKIADQQH